MFDCSNLAGFVIDVTSIGNQLFARATDQPKFELFAIKPGSFFLKVVEASIDFRRIHPEK